MEYNAKEVAEMVLVRDTLNTAFQDFRREMSGEKYRKLMNAVVSYERTTPESIRVEMGREGKPDLATSARLAMEIYNNACFTNK